MAILVTIGLPSPAVAADGHCGIHHEIEVTLAPESHRIAGTDTITLPPAAAAGKGRELTVTLHEGLELTCLSEGIEIRRIESHEGDSDAGHLANYRLSPIQGPTVLLAFSGSIHHPVEDSAEEYARAFSETPGIISTEGVFLSTGSGWYPAVRRSDEAAAKEGPTGDLVTFDLNVTVPRGWSAVSQGVRALHEHLEGATKIRWECPHLQDAIYLVAGRWTEYSREVAGITAYAFLREPDPSLAEKYLQTTGEYVELYSRLIGPYPYKKFALVENFWETGYGMPSFTLLGPKVIRFPFILHSSYPHEILHNWWGNGVFIDPDSGNWCEGLTAYLADHLIKERQGQGNDYRRGTLQKYSDYVRNQDDLPLTAFRSRHDATSEAVGYGKCLMLFHMLRVQLGNEVFLKCIKAFYKEHLYGFAGFDDVEAVFSGVSGKDLAAFFEQWTSRTGAPHIAIDDGGAYPLSGKKGYRFDLVITQKQEEEPFYVKIPVAIYLEGEESARLYNVITQYERSGIGLDLPAKPLRVELDPRYDVFRRLDPRETPPSVGRIFGSGKVLIVLPSKEPEPMRTAWKELAEKWCAGNEAIDAEWDDAIPNLPLNAAAWIFGHENKFRPEDEPDMQRLELEIGDDQVTIGDNAYPIEDHSFMITLRHPLNRGEVIAWLATDDTAPIAGLNRKLPHYGKYSYLVFDGDEPTNVAKGQWPVLQNPMTVNLARGGSPGSTVPQHEPLAKAPEIFPRDRLQRHAAFLADDRLEGRGLGTSGLDEAATYIAAEFQRAGLAQAGDDGSSFFQSWVAETGPQKSPITLKNVVGCIPGRDQALAPLVVGAHYDHLGLGWPDVREGQSGKIHNGADDNASGVAVLIELAHNLAGEPRPERSVILVAFTGEEAGLLGSRHFLEAREPAETVKPYAMINLDSVGRLEGRKLAVLGTGSAKEWIYIVMGVGYTAGIQAESVAQDPGGGDQVAFVAAGIPAVHVFAGPHADYHRPTDDVAKLDLEGMARAALLTREMILYLSARIEPLTVTIAGAKPTPTAAHPAAQKGGARRASLGTMPDFAHRGQGVRVAGVTPGSAAEAAGLREGDVITAVDEHDVVDLAGFAVILKKYSPEDSVTVHFLRDNQPCSAEAVLKAR